MTFKREFGDWVEYRQLPGIEEADFHWVGQYPGSSYFEKMAEVWEVALKRLQEAQQNGRQYLMLPHGSSTSRPGKTTARSQIRRLMRSPEATPMIIRSQCIQHPSCFVAAIKPLRGK